jgi:hypothetical protein
LAYRDTFCCNDYLPNNTITLVIVYKFDLNMVLVNINKFKLYMFINDSTLEHVLTKPSDLTTNIIIENGILELITIED